MLPTVLMLEEMSEVISQYLFFMFVSSNSQELGLRPGIPVGTSLIDAHAGGVGVMESVPDAESKADSQCWFICIFLKKSVLELYIHVL